MDAQKDTFWLLLWNSCHSQSIQYVIEIGHILEWLPPGESLDRKSWQPPQRLSSKFSCNFQATILSVAGCHCGWKPTLL